MFNRHQQPSTSALPITTFIPSHPRLLHKYRKQLGSRTHSGALLLAVTVLLQHASSAKAPHPRVTSTLACSLLLFLIFSSDLTPCTHRVGHHSTSDDSFAYRARSEVEDRKSVDNPIARFRLFMQSQGWWDEAAEEELKSRLKADVMNAFKKAEALKRCELGELFTDVYGGEEPWNLVRSLLLAAFGNTNDLDSPYQKEQREELTELLRKYGDSWQPWQTELAKFKNNGQDLLKGPK